jgi:signal transduction histidine kinase
MSRVPLRLRVTIAFAVCSAVVLSGFALYLHARLASELDASVHSGLRQRASDLVGQGETARPGRGGLIEPGDDLAQVLDRDGKVVAAAPGFEEAPLLTASELAQVQDRAITFRHDQVHDDGPIELLAAPSGDRIVVVGASLEDRDEALASLATLLAIGLPIALLLAAGAGFVVAGSALRPVELLRARAEAIGGGTLGERLPVPRADDEIRRLAETLNGMLDRLESAFDRERAFVADASHELRTPLTRLKAELELAGREGRTADELSAAVRSAAEETERLVRLAEDLLVLARADRGRLPLRPEPLFAADLLDRVRARNAPHVTAEADADLQLEGDPLRLEQALGNLVDNARRHGGGDVTLSAEHDATGAVVLHVRDQGPGIPQPFRAHAFERFSRADEARGEDGGTGLGLAIVRAIARAHGGDAGIDEAPGGGADAWIRVSGGPRRDGADDALRHDG